MKTHILPAIYLAFCTVQPASAYDPPLGIPNPAAYFGSFDPIDAQKPDPQTHCPGWYATPPRDNTRAAGDPRDAYCINRTHPAATDTSNTYGRPDRPRLTVPNKVYQPGDYVEIHGDGNPSALAAPYAANFNPRGAGTDAAPIWIVGVNQPVFTGKLDLGASNTPLVSYLVFDGIQWRGGARVDIRPRNANNRIERIVIRNCALVGRLAAADSTGMSIGASSQTDPSMTTANIVIQNCDISNFGDPAAPGEECGIYQHALVNNLWVLDCHIHHVAEDGIQGGHGHKRTSNGFYIGRCRIHDNVTNGVDLKQTGAPVVISECEVFGHRDSTPNSTGSGENIVLHYSGSSAGGTEIDTWKNWPEDVTVVSCTLHDGDYGVVTSNIDRLRVIGNVIYNIRHSDGAAWNPASAYSKGAALHMRGIKGNVAVAHNTIRGCDSGIQMPDSPAAYNATTTYYQGSVAADSQKSAYFLCIADNGGTGITGIAPGVAAFWRPLAHQIHGNIITERSETTGRDLFFPDADYGKAAWSIDYNLIHSPTGEAIVYGSSEIKSMVQFKSASFQMAHGTSSDPQLKDPSSGDYGLQPASPAIDKGTEGVPPTAYADYLSRYQLDVRHDIRGSPRPLGASWDIGAVEFIPSGTKLGKPPAPKVEILRKEP